MATHIRSLIALKRVQMKNLSVKNDQKRGEQKMALASERHNHKYKYFGQFMYFS